MSSSQATRTRGLVSISALALAGKMLADVSAPAFACVPRALAQPAAVHRGAVGAGHGEAKASDLAGLSLGATAALGVVVAAAGRAQVRGRVAARVAKGAPSLIQVLEQKGLLSFAQNQKLLSQAEKAGLGIQTVEELGLLKFAEKNKLLSTAETLVTNPSTAPTLLAGSLVLGGLAYLQATAPSVEFFGWVLVGAFGAPALVLAITAAVIFGLTLGTSKSRPFSRLEKVTSYTSGGTYGSFKTSESFRDSTLLETVENRGILSFVEENRLLSLASSLVNRPLTLTEGLGVLSVLEGNQVLSVLESQAADNFGPLKAGGLGLVLAPVALILLVLNPLGFGLPAALALLLPALVLIAYGVVISSLSPPARS